MATYRLILSSNSERVLSESSESPLEPKSESDSGSINSATVEDPWGNWYRAGNSIESVPTQPTVSSSETSKTNPEHYRGARIEPWDFIEAQQLDFFLGNAVKYICRAGKKPGESAHDDLSKAIVYLQKKLSTLQ
jgi:hypothetical protein